MLDEESGASDYADVYLDNIIKGNIDYALRWVLMYADATLLSGSGCVKSYLLSNNGQPEVDGTNMKNGYISLPNNFIKLMKVKAQGWQKAVKLPVAEDSEEYLMQSDETAKADKTRPVVALLEDEPLKLELFPKPSASELAQVVFICDSSQSTGSNIGVPDKVEGAFIHYLAYLVMVAWNDASKAQNMLGVAKMELGMTGQ